MTIEVHGNIHVVQPAFFSITEFKNVSLDSAIQATFVHPGHMAKISESAGLDFFYTIIFQLEFGFDV